MLCHAMSSITLLPPCALPLSPHAALNRALFDAFPRRALPCPVSPADLAARAVWGKERCDKVLSEMLREGLAMIDDGAPDRVRLYWFPALSTQQQQHQQALLAAS